MAEQSIVCPHCERKILLSKALTGQIEEKLRREFDTDLKNREREMEKDFKEQIASERQKAEKKVKDSFSKELLVLRKQVAEKDEDIERVRKQAERKAKEALAVEMSSLRQQIAEKEEAIEKVRKQAEKKAKEAVSVEITSLRQQVMEKEEAIEQAQKQEIELRKKQREFERKEKEMELQLARKIDNERRKIETEIISRVTEEHHIKDIEKEKQLSDLKKQIEDLRRKAEQGSQQTQGEAVELELEDLLRANFPFDQITPVGKGVKGADILQNVYSPSGQFCGTIIWESKNTKTWSDGWIEKLKDDQRTAKAEIAAIMTTVLPKDVSHFACIEDVWVTDLSTVIGVASSLRINLTQVAITKLAIEGKSSKMEMIYSYLSGTEFKQRVEAIVESFVSMKDDLEREKRAMETSWAKRDKQIHKVIHNVSGMYGDMQGIIGASLPKIDYLELPSPENDSAEIQ